MWTGPGGAGGWAEGKKWAVAGLPKAVLHRPLQGALPCGGRGAETVYDRGPRAAP